MKTSKKLLALLLALLLMCGLAACADGPAEESSATDTSAEASAGDAADTSVEESVEESVGEEASADEGSTDATGDATTLAPEDGANNTTAKPTAGNTTTKATTQKATSSGWGSRPTQATSNAPAVMDMKGATLTLGTKWITDLGNGDPGDSVTGDKWIAWRKNFEKTFNCKLKNVYVDPYNLFTSLSTKLMSGDKVADIITMQLFDVEAFRHAGLLQPLQKIPNLNLDHPLVNQEMVNLYTYGQNSYLYQAGYYNSEVNTFYVNLDMIKELKLDDPMQLAKEKKWTWAAMDKMAQAAYKDLNKNNKIDNADRFGTNFGADMALGTLRVSGVQVISYNNGKFSYALNNAKTLKYLGAIKDTIKAGNRAYVGEGAHEKFAKGELLFTAGSSGLIGQEDGAFEDADFEIGMLPCPTHEEGMEYTNTCSTWLGGWAIPKNTNQLTEIGYLINASTEMSYSMVADTKKSMIRAWGQENHDLFMTYCNKFNVDAYCWQNQFKDIIKQTMDDTLFDTAVTPAKYLESIDASMKAAVKDYYGKDPDLIE